MRRTRSARLLRPVLAALLATPLAVIGAATGSGASETAVKSSALVTEDAPTSAAQAPTRAGGYLLTASDGGVFALGGAPFFGSSATQTHVGEVVDSALQPGEGGYWQVTDRGQVFGFGTAQTFGPNLSATPLNQPIVGIAATPSGQGYWLVAADGGIFAFGDAVFRGSTGGTTLNQPIVGMAPTPSGQGYWLVASDGGVFSFGDAEFHGSTGGTTLNRPIVGIAAAPSGDGYWLVASDGGIFAFDVPFLGSTGNLTLNQPIVGMSPSPEGLGYVLVASDGGVFSFGDAGFFGSTGSITLNAPIVDAEIVVGGAGTVDVQVLAINDFHGNLVAPSGSSGRVGTTNAGGAAFLSTHVAMLEATNPANTIVVSAGDLIGASPLVSALFHDEPTVEAMNHIGLDLNAVGNHEFDEGATELARMQNGGCHPTDTTTSCVRTGSFAGAEFDFLAANVVSKATGDTLFAPYSIESFSGAQIAFVGMTLEGTPTIVSPSGVAGYDFEDEADTVNALVPELEARGVDGIVVLLHEGTSPTGAVNETSINQCNGADNPSGAVVDIVNRMDPAIDMVISGHTHQPYNCVINGIPVTSAFSFGRLVTDVDLTVDRTAGEISSITINNRIVTRDVTPDPFITDLIQDYTDLSAPIANRQIGSIQADITRTADPDGSGENALGNLIADAQLESSDDPGTGNTVVAFMNPGGVRADLTFAQSGTEGDGVVTYGEAFTVQPFGNTLNTITLTGAQIDAVLEQQFCGLNNPTNLGFFKVLLPSDGFHYTWDQSEAAAAASCATANAVDPTSITINGVVVDPAASYRVTVNNFLADGGDGFTALRGGTDRLGGEVDVDSFEDYLTLGAAAPPALTRIDVVP